MSSAPSKRALALIGAAGIIAVVVTVIRPGWLTGQVTTGFCCVTQGTPCLTGVTPSVCYAQLGVFSDTITQAQCNVVLCGMQPGGGGTPPPPSSVPASVDQACANPTSPLRTLSGLVSIIIHETTTTTAALPYGINSAILQADIAQAPGVSDYSTAASEHYDFFLSDFHGALNTNGAYLTVEENRVNVSAQDSQTANNIDAVELLFADGHRVYADLVARTSLGTGLSTAYILSRGNASRALGVPDDSVPTLGEGNTAITLGFCGAFSTASCGNSILQSGEACDDGNTTAGDGCSALCQIEPGFTCTPPSLPACGDGADNDNDGFTDFPNDPGCQSFQDTDETSQPPVSTGACGNGVCESNEGPMSDFWAPWVCMQDCGGIPWPNGGSCPFCGNGVCQNTETQQSCPKDCPPGSVVLTTPVPPNVCPVATCGDNFCFAYLGEKTTCPQDCP